MNSPKKILFIIGTRPEAIKMAPLIKAFQNTPHHLQVCLTSQHKDILQPVLNFFDIQADIDLDIMQDAQSLFDITAHALEKLQNVFETFQPDVAFVQGDTTTAFTGGLAAYYTQTPLAHVEAGLRTQQKFEPFPEEMNRKLLGSLADFHFCPTSKAVENLAQEGITQGVFQVGNTVIDALHLGIDILEEKAYQPAFYKGKEEAPKILLTTHRRENFGKPQQQIFQAILEIVKQIPQAEVYFPVHPNPKVKIPALDTLQHPRIHLLPPLDYPDLIWLMNKCDVVLTDSGGIQEEAPSLTKPVLVLRNQTERTEGIEAGNAQLVGSDKEKIVQNTLELLQNETHYASFAKNHNPYGDGKTSEKIVKILHKIWKLQP